MTDMPARSAESTITTLTFYQVKAAGRFAWLPESSWLYVPGVGIVEMYFSKAWTNGIAWFGDAEVVENPYAHRGWHHLPECDCEFCDD